MRATSEEYLSGENRPQKATPLYQKNKAQLKAAPQPAMRSTSFAGHQKPRPPPIKPRTKIGISSLSKNHDSKVVSEPEMLHVSSRAHSIKNLAYIHRIRDRYFTESRERRILHRPPRTRMTLEFSLQHLTKSQPDLLSRLSASAASSDSFGSSDVLDEVRMKSSQHNLPFMSALCQDRSLMPKTVPNMRPTPTTSANDARR